MSNMRIQQQSIVQLIFVDGTTAEYQSCRCSTKNTASICGVQIAWNKCIHCT